MIEKLKEWTGSGIVGGVAFAAFTMVVSWLTGSWAVVWSFVRLHFLESLSCAFVVLGAGITIGIAVCGHIDKKKLNAKDAEIAGLRKKAQASKMPGVVAALQTMANAAASLPNEKLPTHDDDFVTFAEMDYEMRCMIYAIDQAGESMTLWPDYEPDFERAISNLDDTDKRQARKLREALGALYDFKFLWCESAPGGLCIYHLTDEAKRLIDADPDMMKRAEKDSGEMLNYLTSVSSKLDPANDSMKSI